MPEAPFGAFREGEAYDLPLKNGTDLRIVHQRSQPLRIRMLAINLLKFSYIHFAFSRCPQIYKIIATFAFAKSDKKLLCIKISFNYLTKDE
jgi:hypothetical protein